MSKEKTPLPKAIDLSHHLSELAKARIEAPLKILQNYLGKPGITSLAGGYPDPRLFPFESIHVDALPSTTFAKKNSGNSSLFMWIWSMFRGSPKTERYMVSKFGTRPEDIDLAHALQYSRPGGMAQLEDFAREFTKKVYPPAYSDWTTISHCGNSDGMSRCFYTLLNPTDSLLVEEWTYPAALTAVKPMGVKLVTVKVDGQGMSAVDLEHVLSTWDEKVQGRRPRVMYTVPVGQNPTGTTMGPERKQAVYDICVRYDIIIIEDDPYFFLQEGTYIPKAQRVRLQSQNDDDSTTFINSLVPTYLKYDYQGRVVRLDSFSKIIAPGSRMGWMTCNPVFAERFERHAETNTQSPSGLSQALIMQLITKQWGTDKFLRWLQGLQGEYTSRRDFMVDTIYDLFDILPATGKVAAFGAGLEVMTAYLKESSSKSDSEKYRDANSKIPLFSFIPPTAGMFVWVKFHVGDNIVLKPKETLTDHIFTDLINEGLLVATGPMFIVDEGTLPKREVFFRISFSNGTQEDMLRGLKILEKVMRKYATI